jgi:hypothetical protein
MKPDSQASGFWIFSERSLSESGASPPHSMTQAQSNSARIIRQVLECAGPAALWSRAANWCVPRLTLRRYRVTPRRNASAFRREVLAGIIHNLRRDSTRAMYG